MLLLFIHWVPVGDGFPLAKRDASPGSRERRDRSNTAAARFLDMPCRIAQERVPTVQCRVARYDMGDRWPARPIAINRQIPGPLVTVVQQRGRNSTRCRRFHLSPLTFHFSPFTPFRVSSRPHSLRGTKARASPLPKSIRRSQDRYLSGNRSEGDDA